MIFAAVIKNIKSMLAAVILNYSVKRQKEINLLFREKE